MKIICTKDLIVFSIPFMMVDSNAPYVSTNGQGDMLKGFMFCCLLIFGRNLIEGGSALALIKCIQSGQGLFRHTATLVI